MHSKLLLTLLAVSILCTQSYSQQIVKTQDLAFWGSIGFDYEFKKDFTLIVSQEFRVYESYTELEKSNSEVGLAYKINRNFKLQGNVRYSFDKKKNKEFAQNLRYNLDLRYKGRITSSLDFKYRIRFQNKYSNLFLPSRNGSESDIRHKISLDYEPNKKHKFSISAEVWREYEQYELPHFGKLRYMISDKIDTNFGGFELFAGVERDIDSKPKLTYLITGVALNFSL